MGMGYEWECPKCGYKFTAHLGSGMLYWEVGRENIEKAKRGEFGEKIKEIFDEDPYTEIDSNLVIFQCEDCGEYENEPVLLLNILREGAQLPPRLDGVFWTTRHEFESDPDLTEEEVEELYELYVRYERKCEKCGGKTIIVPWSRIVPRSRDEEGMICPDCKTPLEIVGQLLWD